MGAGTRRNRSQIEGEKRSLNQKIDSIEDKLSNELEDRRQGHVELEGEVRANRAYFADSKENLIEVLNNQISGAAIKTHGDVEHGWRDCGDGYRVKKHPGDQCED